MDNRGFYDSMGDTFGHVNSVGSYHAYGIDVRVIGFWHDVRRRRFVVKVTFRVGGAKVVANIALDSRFIENLQNAGYILNKRYEQHLMYYIDEQLVIMQPHTHSENDWHNVLAGFLIKDRRKVRLMSKKTRNYPKPRG